MTLQLQDVVFDTNYRSIIPNGGYPATSFTAIVNNEAGTKDKEQNPKTTSNNIFSNIVDKVTKILFPSAANIKTKNKQEDAPENPVLKNQELKEQVKYILEMPEDTYDDKLLTQKLRQYIQEIEQHYTSVISDYKSHISPAYREVKGTEFNISGIVGKSYYVQSYPSYIDALRTRDIFGFHAKWDMSFFIYPEDDSAIQSMLKQKATQLKAEIKEAVSKGITLDTEVEQQYRDVEMIREKLTTREERYFETGYYVSIYDQEAKKLNETGKKFEQKVAGY